jgi:hypothetical protein
LGIFWPLTHPPWGFTPSSFLAARLHPSPSPLAAGRHWAMDPPPARIQGAGGRHEGGSEPPARLPTPGWRPGARGERNAKRPTGRVASAARSYAVSELFSRSSSTKHNHARAKISWPASPS